MNIRIGIILILSVVITVLSAACGGDDIVLSEAPATQEVAGGAAMAGTDLSALTDQESGTDPAQIQGETTEIVYVYVCGEVISPGVYCLQADARIYEAVTLAGGLTEDADSSIINQAEAVTDGMMIRIPAKGSEAAESLSSGQVIASDGSALVDINTADITTLMTLPGIGETKAAAIVTWREQNGRFSSIEDLRNVSGIGDATYSNLESHITVTP